MYCTFGGTSQSLLSVSVTVTKAKRECKNRTFKIAMTEAILMQRRLLFLLDDTLRNDVGVVTDLDDQVDNE